MIVRNCLTSIIIHGIYNDDKEKMEGEWRKMKITKILNELNVMNTKKNNMEVWNLNKKWKEKRMIYKY